MSSKPVTFLDVLWTLLLVFWTPWCVLYAMGSHLIHNRKEVPLGMDMILTAARCTAFLPLSVKRFMVSTISIKDVHKSKRFRGAKQEICQKVEGTGFEAYWVCQGPLSGQIKPTDCDIVIMYIHGGAYVVGHPYMQLVQNLRINELLTAKGYKLAIFSLIYSLAPEHSFPKCFDQAFASYQYLLQQGIDPNKIVVWGESSGGHFAIALFQKIAEAKIPKPLGVILSSPWIDLGNKGESVSKNKRNDMLVLSDINQAVEWAIGDAGAEANSDIYDFSAPRAEGYWKNVLPHKSWAWVGTHELFYDTITAWANNARKDGCDIVLDVEEGKIHGWLSAQDGYSRSKYLSLKPDEDVGKLMPGAQRFADAIDNMFVHR